MININIGKEFEEQITVTNDMLACNIGSGDLKVLSTPMMIALMEKSCHLSIKDSIYDGFSSVGIFIKVNHLYPSRLGATIISKSKIIDINKKIITFEVNTFDNLNTIGNAIHKRAIIKIEEFYKKCL